MAVTLNLSIDDRVVATAVDALDRSLDDLTELMDRIGAALVAGASERIGTTNLSPDGAPWTPSRRARRTGGKTLLLTGALRQSITHRPGPTSVEVGSNLPYAGIHQRGGRIEREPRTATLHFGYDARTGEIGSRFVSRRSKNRVEQDAYVGAYVINMPARPFLGVSAGEEATIGELAAAWLLDAAGAAA